MAPCPIKGIWVQYLSVCSARWGFLPWAVLGALSLWEQAGFICQPCRQEEQAPRHTQLATRALFARGLPGAGTASARLISTQPALTCGNPAPGIAPTPLEWQLHRAGSSSFPVYYFVDWLHHSAVEKFKCFVAFHWEDTTKLKCLDRGSIQDTKTTLILFQYIFSLPNLHTL